MSRELDWELYLLLFECGCWRQMQAIDFPAVVGELCQEHNAGLTSDSETGMLGVIHNWAYFGGFPDEGARPLLIRP